MTEAIEDGDEEKAKELGLDLDDKDSLSDEQKERMQAAMKKMMAAAFKKMSEGK